MRIRGTNNPKCSLCEYAFFDSSKSEWICKLTESATDKDGLCKKFSYDIYKYNPSKKNLFGKFSKEDFEI